MKRRIITGLALLCICLGVIVTRAFIEGQSALAAGDLAAARGDHQAAIERWRRAARWYVPAASHVGKAYDRLQRVADQAAAADDSATELLALRTIRRSIYATRSLWTPHAERLPVVNTRIARLMAKLDAAQSPNPESEAWHLVALQRDFAPNRFLTMLAVMGLFLWVAGAGYFARRGFSEHGGLARRAAIRSAVAVTAGLILWVSGLAFA